jgi:hypothetical protein
MEERKAGLAGKVWHNGRMTEAKGRGGDAVEPGGLANGKTDNDKVRTNSAKRAGLPQDNDDEEE